MPVAKTTVYMPLDVRAALKSQAACENRSMVGLLRRLLAVPLAGDTEPVDQLPR